MMPNSMKESVHPDCELVELPSDFTHSPPEGYHYEVLSFKRNHVSIWTVFDRGFLYNDYSPTYCIWGFYNTKKQQYYTPINSKSIGKEVSIEDTTPYSAMQLNRNPLSQLLYGTN